MKKNSFYIKVFTIEETKYGVMCRKGENKFIYNLHSSENPIIILYNFYNKNKFTSKVSYNQLRYLPFSYMSLYNKMLKELNKKRQTET